MRDGYFRRLISSTIDVDHYALLLRSLKWLGVEARSRPVCVPRIQGWPSGLRRLVNPAIIAQHGAQRGHLVRFQSLTWTFKRP